MLHRARFVFRPGTAGLPFHHAPQGGTEQLENPMTDHEGGNPGAREQGEGRGDEGVRNDEGGGHGGGDKGGKGPGQGGQGWWHGPSDGQQQN